MVLEGDAGEATIEGVPGTRASVAAPSPSVAAVPSVATPSVAAPSVVAPSSTARPMADGDAGGFDALIMVSGGGGAEGRGGKVRTGIIVRTVVAGDRRAPAHLLQRGHGEDILRARAVFRSARAAIGGGGDRHGRALLRGSLLVRLLGRGDRGGTMRSPRWSRDPKDFRLTASNKKRANPSNCIRVWWHASTLPGVFCQLVLSSWGHTLTRVDLECIGKCNLCLFSFWFRETPASPVMRTLL